MKHTPASPSRLVLIALASLTIGYLVGQSRSDVGFALAEVRETTPRSAFLAGSERSETVLREIASTLKTMDGRLERLEKFVGEKKLPEGAK